LQAHFSISTCCHPYSQVTWTNVSHWPVTHYRKLLTSASVWTLSWWLFSDK
jgi:hypothetical protein